MSLDCSPSMPSISHLPLLLVMLENLALLEQIIIKST